jgi:enoyl-CoA hydratase/carnithine racemase
MAGFSSYENAYKNIRLSRGDDGILEVVLHTDGGPLRWSHIGGVHDECTDAFGQIARDADNRVVILTGQGDEFCGPPASPGTSPVGGAAVWEHLRFDALALVRNLLAIPAPVISCLNGPAYRHAEIAILGDIVLAADDALVQDTAHFMNGLVPGDGINIVFPLLMGWNRGRYFLLTGQQVGADELQRQGLVAEVMPRPELLPRAREIARQLASNNTVLLRYTRAVLTEYLRDLVERHLPHSLALEVHAGLQAEIAAKEDGQ